MLAKLDLLLPFVLTIPEGEKFSIYEYTDAGYNISIYPPMRTEQITQDDADEILINGKPAFRANCLRIHFQKESFDRRQEIDCDPPYALIARTINSFLLRLRFVTSANIIRPINFPHHILWYLQYLQDDESELREEKGLVRGRGGRAFAFSYTILNKDIWEEVYQLPPDYNIPQWVNLLLDAKDALPEIGLTIVLAVTALEVFISHILNELSKNSSIPKDMWEWINNRDQWLAEPTLGEKLDILLKILLGFSLKENGELWKSFNDLRQARNSFVHEGVAKIKGEVISEEEAQRLLTKAGEIIKFIKDKLPNDLQWPEYKHSINITFMKKLIKKD